jgi:hypothetical protein
VFNNELQIQPNNKLGKDEQIFTEFVMEIASLERNPHTAVHFN